MLLNEETKTFIKDELNAITTLHQERFELAQYKFKNETNELIEKYQKTLNELNIFKWSLRFVFAVLLGGSIVSILKLQDYLDNRIATRMEKMDRLYTALALVNASEWQPALVEFDGIYSEIKDSGFKPSQQYKRFLFRNFIYILAKTDNVSTDGSWTGQSFWDKLTSDSDFAREFKLNDHWRNNNLVNNDLAVCTLKYVKTNDAIHVARNYFQAAYDAAISNDAKAPNLHGLAIIDLIEGNLKDASEKMRTAEQMSPSQYKIEDKIISKDYFLTSAEGRVWREVSQRVKGKDFDEQYNRLLNVLSSR